MSRAFRLVLYTDASRLAGAERVLGDIAAHLDPAIDVVVVGPDASVVEAVAAKRPGATTRIVPRVAGRDDLRAMRAQRRALAAVGADVVHVNLTDMAACLPTIGVLASLRQARIVVVEHHPFPPQSVTQQVLKIASGRVIDAHIAVSTVLAAAVAEVARLDATKIRVIANGVEPAEALDVTGDPATFLTACRLDRDKGVDVLLEAVALVPGLCGTIAGDGPERARLEARCGALGLGDRVRFVGWVDDLDTREWAASMFVLASRAEALPLSILEAMHRGLPVVVTDVGGVRDAVIDGVTGTVVPPEDPVALAAALGSLAGSVERRAAFGAAGRTRARERFGVASMVAAYEAVYRELAATPSGRRPWGPRR